MIRLRKISWSGAVSGFNQYLIVIIVIALTALLCRPLADQQGYYVVSFILLFVVSIMAAFLGIGPIFLASTMSALVWNWFFIPPHHAFHIYRTEDKLMFVSFFIIAMINGILTNRIRKQEKLALEREERTNAIYELTKDLSNANGVKEIYDIVFRDCLKYFNATSVYFLKTGGSRVDNVIEKSADGSNKHIDNSIAEWVFKNSLKAGRFTEFYNETGLTYYPMTGKRINPGVIAIEFEEQLNGEKEMFWNGYLAQVSNAMEREQLSELALKARLLDESGRLYKTLFTLISHEFRIPIATIMGASDTLLMPGTSDPDKKQLSSEIYKASARLNHLVENLLNMSRLESGKLAPRPDWCDINDLLNKVINSLDQELEPYHLTCTIPDEMPLVRLDFGLMEQVIYNLLLNSCQNSHPGSAIELRVSYISGNLFIAIEDEGPGFPPELLGSVFNKFFRVDNSKPGGLGLGLSIVKGVVEAHRGHVTVENREPRGARFRIAIPTEAADIGNLDYEQ